MNNIRKYIFPLTVTCMLLLLMMGCKKHETYTVTFNANGGTGKMEAQTFTDGEAQALSRNAFTYDGYTFSGWNTVQGGSGASYTDGQAITATADMTLYAQWTAIRHEYVDLGLPSGTKWATCNVGANTPEEYGDYFAWGETITKTAYEWGTYKYCNGDHFKLTKYCSKAEYGNDGFVDALTTLEASDDAATANWGAGWRMPTYDEMVELKNVCTVSWTTNNGVNGRLFTGPNGNSIFLPAAGYPCDGEINDAGSYGYYWSSSIWECVPCYAKTLDFYSVGSVKFDDFGRGGCGFSVRPVLIESN